MEEHTNFPTEVNSADIVKALQTSFSYLDRKRKLHAEQLGIPPPKHVCSNQNYALAYDCSPEDQGFFRYTIKQELNGIPRADESEQESANDSNSVGADSMISVSGEAECHWYSEESSLNQPSSSSGHSTGDFSKSSLRSLETRTVTKSCDIKETSSIEKKHDMDHPNFELHDSMNYEDHLLEFGGLADFKCSEGTTSFEECTDKELEEMIYPNEVTPNNYILSSGRWTVNQDAGQDHKKLTIDKEFEQYFSSLML